MAGGVTIEEVAKHIASLEKQKTKLLLEVHQVEQELLSVKARHAKLKNQTLAIAKLPHEILSTIFLLCHGTSLRVKSTVTRPFEVVASHVSTHWRTVVLATPLLWHIINLHITNQTRSHALQRLSAHLIRSDECLLAVCIYLAINDGVLDVLDYLIPHAYRWHRISISLDHGSADDVYIPLQQLSAPRLTHLSLRIGNPDDKNDAPRTEYPHETSPPILLQGAPSLLFVRLAGQIVGNISPPLSNVQIFHIDAWPKNLMRLAQFHSLLAALPRLVHLSLTGLSIHLPRDPLQSTEAISLPTLRSLRIRGNSTTCRRLLSLISLPKLESLHLHGVDSFDSDVVPSLRSLTLVMCEFSKYSLENILRAFPRVNALDIDDWTADTIYFLLTPDSGVEGASSMSWPELQTISLRQLPSRSVISFVHLCLRRLECGSPFQRVYLDRRSRFVVKGKDLLDGLGELQPVENLNEHEPWPSELGYEDPDDSWF